MKKLFHYFCESRKRKLRKWAIEQIFRVSRDLDPNNPCFHSVITQQADWLVLFVESGKHDEE